MIHTQTADPEATERSDVAILAAPTFTAREMLRNVARACVLQGLSVEILVPEIADFYSDVAAGYRDLGVPIRVLALRSFASPGWGYPRPVGLLTMLPRLLGTLDRLAPRCVVTHIDSSDLWRGIHWWARRRGVPGIVVQEGASAERKSASVDPALAGMPVSRRYRVQMAFLRLLLPGLFRFAELNMYAEHVCVWGAAMKRYLVRAGRDPGDITITGNPRFDRVVGRPPLPDKSLATVLFAHQHQPLPDRELAFCRALIDVCANRIRCRLLFRPHPRSRLWGRAGHDFVRGMGVPEGSVIVIDQGELSDYLPQASVFVTFYSTAIYDAVLHGIPLVLSDWCSPVYRFNAAQYGASIDIASPADLEAGLRTALFDDETRRTLYRGGGRLIEEHLHALDGRASARVAQRLASMLRPGAAPWDA